MTPTETPRSRFPQGVRRTMLLPADLLIPVFSALGTPKDLGRCAQVCRAFRKAIHPGDDDDDDDDEAASKNSELRQTRHPQVLWREIACRRYGADLAESTLSQYADSYRDMIKDDNRRGVAPLFPANVACRYRFNRDAYYFCCIVVSVSWDRLLHSLWVHLDARGETDLRHPMGSVLLRNRRIARADEWRSEVQVARPERPGHFKGRLRFTIPPGLMDWNEGEDPTLSFCYAHTLFHHDVADYSFAPLINVREAQDPTNWTTFLRRDGSPFRNDTPRLERERWEPRVPPAVLHRAAAPGLPPWWVEPEEAG